jgi:excisionase family DNA binding protein
MKQEDSTSQQLYSVEQVADLLGLHVRTVRNYVREGRLKAIRIGKQYRIAREDLQAMTGRATVPLDRESVARQRHVEVSSIVEIDAISPETVSRLTNSLIGAAHGRQGDEPLRIENIYDQERARLKIILVGGLETNASLLKFIKTILES